MYSFAFLVGRLYRANGRAGRAITLSYTATCPFTGDNNGDSKSYMERRSSGGSPNSLQRRELGMGDGRFELPTSTV